MNEGLVWMSRAIDDECKIDRPGMYYFSAAVKVGTDKDQTVEYGFFCNDIRTNAYGLERIRTSVMNAININASEYMLLENNGPWSVIFRVTSSAPLEVQELNIQCMRCV